MGLHILRAALLATTLATSVLVAPAIFAPSAFARGTPDGFADLAAELQPAVVNISSTQAAQKMADRGPGDGPSVPPGSPFEQFFRDFLDRNRPGQGGPGRRGPQEGPDGGGGRAVSLGSGFIIDPAGYIVTNNHVIEGADEITVTLTDNTVLKAKLVGKDERVDLALLKVESDKPLHAVAFGDSDAARVGDWVLAIGNPFGLGGSVTAGIVSARAGAISGRGPMTTSSRPMPPSTGATRAGRCST